MNENCLEGLRCPNCKQDDTLHIAGTSLFYVIDDGTTEHEDVEWDDDSFARCPQCGFEGKLCDFRENAPVPEKKVYEVFAYIKKRYTAVIKALSKDDAVRKASDLFHVHGIDVEELWEEDNEFYDVEFGDDAREVEGETPFDT